MKTLTDVMSRAISEGVAGAQIDNLNEKPVHCKTADVNPGNGLNCGVSNHYTPIENIVTNVRNLFAIHLGVVASVAEDGVSLKLNSTKFVSKDEVEKILNNSIYNDIQSIKSYVMAQGLNKYRIECVGKYFIVYFYATDIKAADKGKDVCPNCNCSPCTCGNPHKLAAESLTNDAEVELAYVNEDDEEMEEMVRKEIIELIDSPNKIKAAHAIADKIAAEIELIKDVYMAAVKDADGNESIALRMNCPERRPFGKTETVKRSLFNIYNSGKDGIWVPNWDKPELLTKEVKDLIQTLLSFLGAKETNDPCSWQLCDGDNLKQEPVEAADEDAEKPEVEDEKVEDTVPEETEEEKDKEESEDEKDKDKKKKKKDDEDDEDEDDEDVDEASDEDSVFAIVDKDGVEATVASTKEMAKELLKDYEEAGTFTIKRVPRKDYIKD